MSFPLLPVTLSYFIFSFFQSPPLSFSLYNMAAKCALTLLSMFRHATLNGVQQTYAIKCPRLVLYGTHTPNIYYWFTSSNGSRNAQPRSRSTFFFTLAWSPKGKSLTKSFSPLLSICQHLLSTSGLIPFRDLVNQPF